MIPDLYTKIQNDLAAWEEATSGETSTFITSTPYVVATEDCALALLIKDNKTIPVFVKPSSTGRALGVTHMSKEDAIRIAAARGDGYQPVLAADLPARRMRSLRQMRLDMETGVLTMSV